ncbi:tetratricopeptide repeat protein [Saccharicrinis aurantiacus]|uniref:tetratricopeptide repeat protein n=1 Tax=Saccharicrinis aurantiacus TaxID=1849719 RepID=UPI002492E774|nr:hypothetical protein [Saccharicrinis aurantiacus]
MVKKIAFVYLMFIALSCNYALAEGKIMHFNLGLNQIINLQFDSARYTISKIDNNAERLFLNHYSAFFAILVNKDAVANANYSKKVSQTLKGLQEADDHPNKMAFISEVYFQKSLIQYQNNNLFSALSSFSNAYSYYKKSESGHPGLRANKKLNALYNLLFSNLPKMHSNVASWFGMSGSQELGFKLLNEYLQDVKAEDGLHSEALLFNVYSLLKFNVEDDQITQFFEEHGKTLTSPFLQAITLQCAFKIRQPDLFNAYVSNSDSQFWMLRYLNAKNKLLHNDARGIKEMTAYLASNTFKDYKADGYNLLSWYYAINSDTAAYWHCQKALLQLEEYPTSEDKKAKYEAELHQYPNECILLGRMLFDAGYFKQAIVNFDSGKLSVKKSDLLEFYYRYARALEYLGRTNEALIYYEKAIGLSADDKRYFGPYAAFYSAQIYDRKNDRKNALQYYKLGNDLNNGEYKNAISTKIDMALSKL